MVDFAEYVAMFVAAGSGAGAPDALLAELVAFGRSRAEESVGHKEWRSLVARWKADMMNMVGWHDTGHSSRWFLAMYDVFNRVCIST